MRLQHSVTDWRALASYTGENSNWLADILIYWQARRGFQARAEGRVSEERTASQKSTCVIATRLTSDA